MDRPNHMLKSLVYTLTTSFNDWITQPSDAMFHGHFSPFANYFMIALDQLANYTFLLFLGRSHYLGMSSFQFWTPTKRLAVGPIDIYQA